MEGMGTKLGTELIKSEQREVLAAFTNRYTEDRIPKWVYTADRPYPVQFASDEDWLEHTWFEVDSDGGLIPGVKYCESSPTWPRNPELREASKSKITAEKCEMRTRAGYLGLREASKSKITAEKCEMRTRAGYLGLREASKSKITAEDVAVGRLVPKLDLVSELVHYLDGLRITSDNIGQIRRECFVSWSSAYNGIVRDETAAREGKEPKFFGSAH
jgi:hypothetical protein